MFGAKLFVVFYVLYTSLYTEALKREGDLCTFDNIQGMCKKILDCPYAIRILNEEEKKPPMCRWQGTTRIVCCPASEEELEENIRKTKVTDSILEPENTTCKNEVTLHPQEADLSEPAGCPELPRPEINDGVQHLAWSKCLDYQRYSNRCVPINKEGTIFRRIDSCAVTDRSYEYQVMGGYPASPAEFPHLVVLGFEDYAGEIAWKGAGSLISDKFILSAAHILIEYGEVKYALMGALNKTDVNSGVIYNVKRAIPYIAYTEGSNKNDLILLELQERVMLNEYIRPACLPVPGREIENERSIAGWGGEEREEIPNILLTTTVRENVRRCMIKFQRSTFDPRTMICVKGNIGSTGVFRGDSGGPLMASMTNLKCTYSIEGVASKASYRDATAIYVNVSKYLDWIVRIVWPDDYSAWIEASFGER